MAIEQPHDSIGHPLQGSVTPRGLALATHVKALASSTHYVLNSATKYLRVYAISKDVYLKWATGGEDYATEDDFDEVIIAGQYVDFMVPLKINGVLYTDIQVVGRESGATVVIIEK